nr:zinc finger protein 836-like [Aedes albopictus]
MSLSQYSSACRLCLGSNTTFYEIFSNRAIEEKIRNVFKFTVKNNYRLSHLICLTCHENLIRFDEFVNRVGYNQQFLERIQFDGLHATVPLNTVEAGHGTVHIALKLPEEPPQQPGSECGEIVDAGAARSTDVRKPKKKKTPKNKGDELIRQNMTLYCDICGERSQCFEDYSTLQKHFKDKHETRGYVMCCEKKFIRKDRLLDHIRLHLDPDAFKCAECDHRSKSAVLLDIHRRQHNANGHRYVCHVCDKTFVTKGQLYNHMPKHGIKRYACDVCGKGFGHKFSMTKHRIMHDVPDKFICDICAKPLATEDSLKAHIRAHSDKSYNKVQCNFCAKWFKNEETLRSHQNARHKDQREHRCEQCDKLYPTGSALLEHVRMVHRKEPNFGCEHCDKKFYKRAMLKEHVKRSHSGPTPKALFQCEFCDKEYLHSNNYFFHRKKAHPAEYAQLRHDREQQREGLVQVQDGAGSTPTTSGQ